MICLVVLAALMTGCRRLEGGQAATPTATVTPRSTPLPPLATPIPPGAEGNPLQLIIRPGSQALARSAVPKFNTALNEQTGLTIEVVVVDRYAEALAALCESAGGRVSAVWMDGIAYLAATAEQCGSPALQVERGSGRNARTGETVQIIANAKTNIDTIAKLKGSEFCRVSFEDSYSWLIPSLMMQAAGVSPLEDLESIRDYPDTPELLEAVAEGDDCDAAAVAAADLEDASADVREAVNVVAESAPIPYAILMYPPQVPLGAQLAINDALIAIANDPDTGDAMEDLLGQSDILRVEPDDFDALVEFAGATGLNFAQLGS